MGCQYTVLVSHSGLWGAFHPVVDELIPQLPCCRISHPSPAGSARTIAYLWQPLVVPLQLPQRRADTAVLCALQDSLQISPHAGSPEPTSSHCSSFLPTLVSPLPLCEYSSAQPLSPSRAPHPSRRSCC